MPNKPNHTHEIDKKIYLKEINFCERITLKLGY